MVPADQIPPRDLAGLWSSAPWQADLQEWLLPQLRRLSLTLTGPIEVARVRCWSVLLRVPTTGGLLWCKENSPAQLFEAALLAELARLAPGYAVAPLSVDRATGRMLTPDAGDPLTAPTVADWTALLSRYAALQRALVPHTDRLLATGLTVMRTQDAGLDVMTSAVWCARLPQTHPLAPPPDFEAVVSAGLRSVQEDSRVLVASGIPASLQHNDLHPGNLLVTQPGGAGLLIDFADAVWAHPFAVLAVPVALMRRGGLSADEIDRAVDAYLEQWTDYAPLGDLRDLLPAAYRLAALHRATSWLRVLRAVPPATVPEQWRDAAWWWLGAAASPDPWHPHWP